MKRYKLAAAEGNPEAQYNIGVMYYNGQGVGQDKEKAKEWFGKACDNGFQRGCDKFRELDKK
ncbi:hypothetical protein OO006_09600 [Prosthecochloris sp. SCSIO W1101]|nr:hypothetical protein [Prosthecochloris sp. SCSIO W1101]UZJ42776.1 hypothetical protein OO006_09600 [Prosthecochloris sp. SCSIO W1101]